MADAELAPETSGEVAALGPVAPLERIAAIDVLRGVAILGILPMNIPFFAGTSAVMFHPPISGGFSGANYWVWNIGHLIFEFKMMTLFSMLFGAGLIVMSDRAAARARSLAAFYYRRVFWLLIIGLVHAYGLWYGDILVNYALCGMLIYPLRGLPAKWLILLGVCLMLVAVPLQVGSGFFFDMARSNAIEAQEHIDAGAQPSQFQLDMEETWEEVRVGLDPTPADLASEERDYLEGGAGLFKRRAGESLWMQTMGMLIFGLWRPGGAMLLGMGLMKLGIFSAARSRRAYALMATLGLGLGWPLVALGAHRLEQNSFDIVYSFKAGLLYNYIGSLFAALGYVGLVMLIVKSRILPRAAAALGNAGRMALSNYLMQSIICTTIFYGYGFALWGKLERIQWLGIVLAIWAFQLVLSAWWLAKFRFGPAEWLWRSLTYWKKQPMRRDPYAP